MDGTVAGVILAAGESRRFGGARKQLALLDGRTLLEHVIATAAAAELDPIVAVVPVWLTRPARWSDPRLRWVRNPHPERGMSHSLRLGFAALPPSVGATIILLGDQPTLPPSRIAALVAARDDQPIVAASAGGRAAPPVLLERSHFAVVEQATGDAGLGALLEAHPEWVRRVEFHDPVPDVDTPADLAALEEACPGCGARFAPTTATESHPYLGASPACWSAFGELLAREFGDRAHGWIHRRTVDVYAVQHPGTDGRRQRQSVVLHLVGLCHWLEHDLDVEHVNAITRRLTGEPHDWPWLPAPGSYPITVLDALAATSATAHGRTVRRWGESTWAAWHEQHEVIRRIAAAALA